MGEEGERGEGRDGRGVKEETDKEERKMAEGRVD